MAKPELEIRTRWGRHYRGSARGVLSALAIHACRDLVTAVIITIGVGYGDSSVVRWLASYF